MTINWNENKNWEKLPKPEVDDKVELTYDDGPYKYRVKALVTEGNSNNTINIKVLESFSETFSGGIGNDGSLKDEYFQFIKRIYLQNVLKKLGQRVV